VVTFATSDTASPGTASLTVSGTGAGLTRTATILLTVNAPPGDFALSAVPTGLGFSQGPSAVSVISIDRMDGFPSSISFSASGLPAGVTATFTPAATAGSETTLTLTASADATVGLANVTVAGTGGGITRTTSINIAVNEAPTPDFSLSAVPGGLSLFQGGDPGISVISIIAVNAFSASVSFTAAGLPAGVTATFAPPTTTGSEATLTLVAAAGAAVGPATVVVTGTGGGLTRSTSIAIFVDAPPGG
jgi:hypothetical protein